MGIARNQVWASCRYGSVGCSAYLSDLLTVRFGVEYDFDIRCLCARLVVLGVTLWLDIHFKPSVFDEADRIIADMMIPVESLGREHA